MLLRQLLVLSSLVAVGCAPKLPADRGVKDVLAMRYQMAEELVRTARKIASLGQQAYSGTGPYLDHGTMVWSQWDGEDLEIYLYRDGQTARLTDNTTMDRNPVVSGGRVLWSCDEDICLFAGGAARVLDRGACEAPDAHGGQAAWICANRVTLFDGEQIHRLTGDGSGKLKRTSVRLHGGRLVWLELRGLPSSGHGARATLVFSDGERTQDVTEVGLPCLACSVYWPPLSLSLSQNVVAWSYATPLPGAKPPHSFCAYAEIVPVSRCAP